MDWIAQYAWIGALLFARVGAVMMMALGVGEQMTPARVRLAIALLLTLVVAPTVAAAAPAQPKAFAGAVALVVGELATGLVLGSGARVLMSALQIAGNTVGMASGLSFAQQIDPINGGSGAVFSAFYSLLGVVLVFATGLHRTTIVATAESYAMLPPGAPPPWVEAPQLAIASMSAAFRLGVQMAAPVLVFSLAFNIALGLVSRLVPQLQAFMVAMPASVMLGIAVAASGLGGGLMIWLEGMGRAARFLPLA